MRSYAIKSGGRGWAHRGRFVAARLERMEQPAPRFRAQVMPSVAVTRMPGGWVVNVWVDWLTTGRLWHVGLVIWPGGNT